MRYALLLLVMLMPLQAEAKTLAFDVFRDDSRIGTHVVTLAEEGDTTRVSVAIDFKVRLLGITVYRYTHRNEEVWQGETLLRMQSQTDDDGTDFAVTAEKKGDEYVITNNNGTYTTPAPLYTTSYWLASMVRQPQLLDTQDGTLTQLSFMAGEPEMVPVGGQQVFATPYTITGDMTLSVWYSDAGEWVKLQFPREDGSVIRYQRQG